VVNLGSGFFRNHPAFAFGSTFAMSTSAPKSFFDYSREELEQELLAEFGLPRYRAQQLFEWVYRRGVYGIAEMSNIGKKHREQLVKKFIFPEIEILKCQKSVDGSRKYLLKLSSEQEVEAVMIKQGERFTLCLSSQYGCGMACSFCQTGTMGFRRHLSTSEIVLQALAVLNDSRQYGESFSNVVFMGMGEPLHNFDNVVRAIRILTDDFAFGLGQRKVTVSTVGLVPAIKKFAQVNLGVNLAVSLNATTDEVRSQIMPINKRFQIRELLDSLKEIPLGGRKRITIEYVLLRDVNDSEADMRRLRDLMRGLPVKVNLIPYNDNAGLGYRSPSNKHVIDWCQYLNEHGVQTTIRWSKGLDIEAACGQLVTGENAKKRDEERAKEEYWQQHAISLTSSSTMARERMDQMVRFGG
jgi:23S rRNA (adenine2503-C2)-methyltransferase